MVRLGSKCKCCEAQSYQSLLGARELLPWSLHTSSNHELMLTRSDRPHHHFMAIIESRILQWQKCLLSAVRQVYSSRTQVIHKVIQVLYRTVGYIMNDHELECLDLNVMLSSQMGYHCPVSSSLFRKLFYETFGNVLIKEGNTNKETVIFGDFTINW